MGDKTGIEWTDATWNPVVGCQVASPGCDNCYAARDAAGRLKNLPQYQGLAIKEPGKPAEFTGVVRCLPERLSQPLAWKRPRRIFVNSMSDLFHHDVPDGFIVAVWEVMRQCPQHTFQILTKRPQRMASWLQRWHDVTGEDFVPKLARGPEATRAAHPSPKGQLWVSYLEQLGEPPEGAAYPTFDWMDGPLRMQPTCPLPNVWVGTSIESDRYCFRADRLREAPAAVRFISAEPLLGSLPSLNLTGIDWLIVGGESGPGARPMHPDWVRQLRDRCHPQPDEVCPSAPADDPGHCEHWSDCEACCRCGDDTRDPVCDCELCAAARAAAPSFLFKQWGEWAPIDGDGVEFGRWVDPITGGTHATAGPGRVLMSRFGKRSAGRDLDGRTWDEFPEPRR